MPTSSSKEPDVGTFLYNTLEHVLRCFENVLRRNVPTSGLKEPDVGTFLYNKDNLNMLDSER